MSRIGSAGLGMDLLMLFKLGQFSKPICSPRWR